MYCRSPKFGKCYKGVNTWILMAQVQKYMRDDTFPSLGWCFCCIEYAAVQTHHGLCGHPTSSLRAHLHQRSGGLPTVCDHSWRYAVFYITCHHGRRSRSGMRFLNQIGWRMR